MRIGVISDTHNHLPNVARIAELLNEARVERVVHTGDITQAKTLRALAALDAPLVGVFGNNDVEREALTAACAELALHGHDHRTAQRWQDGALVFNPGECAGHLAGHNRVGVVDLLRLEAELLYF